MVDERCAVVALNPQLWKKLPNDLLERVLTKVPFSSLVTFRTVSKFWNAVIIPRVAPFAQASTPSVLLYFNCVDFRGTKPSPGWFSQLWNSKWGPRTNDPREFQTSSFPTPRMGEYVRLVASEGGLLFISFVDKKTSMARKIVVCNPLTGQSKSLCLPSSLRFPILPHHHSNQIYHSAQPVLMGVVVNTENGSYKLLTTGVADSGLHSTLIYDSLACTWKTSSPLPLNDPADFGKRSLSCNGNLYWFATSIGPYTGSYPSSLRRFILKYDLVSDTWNKIVLDDGFQCGGQRFPEVRSFSQIASCSGQVVLSHVHRRSSLIDDRAPEQVYDELFEFDCPIWKHRSDLPELEPEMTLMTEETTDEIERFLLNDHDGSRLESMCDQYFVFGNQDLLYHVFLRSEIDVDIDIENRLVLVILKIAVQNIFENSYTWLPVMDHAMGEDGSMNACNIVLDPTAVWAFSPTFHSV